MWMMRNPMGGMLLTKSPNGIARTPFLPVAPARRVDPVDEDAGEDEDHSEEHDEGRRVLAHREPRDHLVMEVRDERVLDEVRDEAEDDRQGTCLRGQRDRESAG